MHSHQQWVPPNLLFSGYRRLFSGIKPSSGEIKKEWELLYPLPCMSLWCVQGQIYLDPYDQTRFPVFYFPLSSLCSNFPYIRASTYLRTAIKTIIIIVMMIMIIIIVRVLSAVAKLQKFATSFVLSVRPARQMFTKLRILLDLFKKLSFIKIWQKIQPLCINTYVHLWLLSSVQLPWLTSTIIDKDNSR